MSMERRWLGILLVALLAFGVGVIVVYVVTSLLIEENKRTLVLMKVLG